MIVSDLSWPAEASSKMTDGARASRGRETGSQPGSPGERSDAVFDGYVRGRLFRVARFSAARSRSRRRGPDYTVRSHLHCTCGYSLTTPIARCSKARSCRESDKAMIRDRVRGHPLDYRGRTRCELVIQACAVAFA